MFNEIKGDPFAITYGGEKIPAWVYHDRALKWIEWDEPRVCDDDRVRVTVFGGKVFLYTGDAVHVVARVTGQPSFNALFRLGKTALRDLRKI